MTPPLLNLSSQGSDRGPDADISIWLVWIAAGLLLALLLLRSYA